LFEALKKDEVELDEGTMDGITLHDDNDGGHNVHYKGQQIGSVWKRKSGTWAHYHDDSGDNDHKHSNKKEAIQAVKNAHSMSEGVIVEEPTSAEFDAQLADAKQRAAGTKKQPEVSKPAVQAVQNEETHTTVEVWDLDTTNGVQISEIDLEERSLSEPEMKKKEEIVKSMKKGISGFKERYGKDAKSVMYATATKRAMGEEVEQIEEETPDGYQNRDGRLIPKIHPTMTPHEHGHDYTSQSIEDAKSKSEIHSQHREILKDNPHPKGSKEHKDWEAGANKAKADHLKDWS
jgi:hypothetical protein